MLLFLSIIILVGIAGAISFLRMNDNVEPDSGLNAYDFEIGEIK